MPLSMVNFVTFCGTDLMNVLNDMNVMTIF